MNSYKGLEVYLPLHILNYRTRRRYSAITAEISDLVGVGVGEVSYPVRTWGRKEGILSHSESTIRRLAPFSDYSSGACPS